MRIISLVPSITETLFELGLGDQIVAVTRWCTRPAEKVIHKPKVGGTKNPKLQSILEFKPDIVILDCDENRKEDAKALEKNKIRTFTVFPKTIDDSIHMIRQLGELFSVQPAAAAMTEEIQKLREAYKPDRIYESLILIWRKPYMTINADTYVHSACELFGFRNVFASHQKRYPPLTPEEIEQIDPEMILFPDEPYPFRRKHLDLFQQEFPGIRAVSNGQMFLFDGSHVAWHGFGTLRALREFPLQFLNKK
ncbi:helical backbone metal receptor [bacterium]|nr:helical backbone metal receptor [bacterium]MCI0602206.1 helical backbone metal receptor [bacterium]